MLVSNFREPLGYRIKEDTEDEDIVEVMNSKKTFKTTQDRFEIAFNINCWNMPTYQFFLT